MCACRERGVKMRELSELLAEAAAVHGHICPGQVLGVRMAAAGCRSLGIDEPKGSKRLLVYVEIVSSVIAIKIKML